MSITVSHKRFLLLLLLALLVFFRGFSAFAQAPEVNTPLENRLYQGSPDKITAFIKQQQEKIAKLVTEIDRSVDKNTTQKRLSKVTAVKDLLHGLSLQYKSLLAELSRPSPSPPQKPTVKEPPYKLEVFDRVILFQRQVNVQSADSQKKLEQLKNRLDSLKKAAVVQLAAYAKLKKTAPAASLDLDEYYGQLLLTQCEYALLQIKVPKLEKTLAQLDDNKKIAADLVGKVFPRLEITSADIITAQQLSDKSQDLCQKTIDATSSEYQDFNRRFLIYEAQLNGVLSKISGSKEDVLAREGWQIEQARIELILDALKLRIQLINQQRLRCKIKFLKNNFRLQWLTADQTRGKKLHFVDLINKWFLKADKLDGMIEAITASISSTTLIRSNMTQKLATIFSQNAAAKTPKLQNALESLSRQAGKVNENIDKVILLLSENVQEIRNVKTEIKQILELTRFSISYSERVRTWADLHFTDVKEQVQSVLYYPLFSIGSSVITLMIIIKIVFLLLLGIISLRWLRRQVARLLAEKVGMSTGAINSITTLGYYIFLLFGTIVILSSAGLDLSQLSIILGALGVGIGFGLQTITNNFISGIILLSEQTVKVGDYVRLEEGLAGEVKKMAIRATVVRTAEGEDVIVPNSEFISSRVNSWTYGDDWRRLNIPFGVSYDSDPDEVVRLAEAAAREVAITREDARHPVRVFFEGFGDNSLDFSIRVWCRMARLIAPSGLKSDYYFALFKKFKEAGISIPFPQQDLHLQSASPELTEALKGLMAPEKNKT
ncbi:MAG: mechanosensitive ion channel [Xanthomonadaceae bacterium]|nr:mechanosensitive ion channel [Xanthomonadaceae bacterium]